MQETFIKVGQPPDFIMSKARMEYFHSASVSIFDSKDVWLDTRRFSSRSLVTLKNSIGSFIGPRVQEQSRNLNIDSKIRGLFSIQSSEVNIEVRFQLEELLSETDKENLLNAMNAFLRVICESTK